MEGVLDRLAELLVILVAAKVGAEAMARLRQPAVIGELVVGMIVGASVLAWVNVDEGTLISTLAEIGVILLLFEVGLETDLRDFVRLGRRAASVALIGVVTPFGLGFFAARALDLAGGSTEVAIFLGAAMTATSVGITARVFADLRRLDTDEARTIIGAAVIDDVIGLIILAVVAGLLSGDGGFEIASLFTITGKALVFLVVVVVVGVALVPYFFRFLRFLRVEGSFVVGSFVFAIAVGIAAERLADLEPIVGAFAAGLVAGQTEFSERIHAELRPVAFLFVPIFFLAIGAQVDVGVLLEPRVLLAGGVISLLAVVGKLVSGWGAGTQMSRSVVGVGMVPRGEVGLIFAALGAGELSAVVGSEENAIVVLMVVVTTLAAPLVLNVLLRKQPVGEQEPSPQLDGMLDTPFLGGAEVDESRPDVNPGEPD